MDALFECSDTLKVNIIKLSKAGIDLICSRTYGKNGIMSQFKKAECTCCHKILAIFCIFSRVFCFVKDWKIFFVIFQYVYMWKSRGKEQNLKVTRLNSRHSKSKFGTKTMLSIND